MPYKYLITGASSDVGVLLISRLLAADPQCTILAQGHGHISQLAQISAEHPGRIQTFDVDLSCASARGMFLQTLSRMGAVPTHFVHLPALRVVNTKFKNFDMARFEQDMQVQVMSAIEVCKCFVPLMAKSKFGRVLFMLTSYILGVPPKNTAAYVMAKQALQALAKSLAAEYASFGVTVNCVAPSMMETKFLADTPSLIVQAAAESNPMGRNATAQDVVPAMQFLLSDDAAFITGVTLPITGGSA